MNDIDYTNPLLMLAAAAVITLGAGRLTRIITYDDFPPAAHARALWDRITNDGPWSKLAHCFWCAGPWVTLVALGSGILSGLHWGWWLFWGWLALSYVTSIIIARDEPRD
jgi:hypothetical protein